MIQQNFQQGDDLPSEELTRRIAVSRARVSSTIEELGTELSPKRLFENYIDENSEVAISALSEKAKSLADTAVSKIKANPIPALILAAGLAYFIKKMSEDSGDQA